jgi:hypothetical protein
MPFSSVMPGGVRTPRITCGRHAVATSKGKRLLVTASADIGSPSWKPVDAPLAVLLQNLKGVAVEVADPFSRVQLKERDREGYAVCLNRPACGNLKRVVVRIAESRNVLP